MAKLKTNEDLIRDLMNISPYGAICQAFIMQSLQEKCKEIISNKEETLKEEAISIAAGKRPMVTDATWIGIAENIQDRMDAFYNPPKK